MAKHRSLVTSGWLIAALTLAADQLSKWLLIQWLQNRPPVAALSILDLVMVWNRGISFGMLSGHSEAKRIFLIIMAIVIVAVLARWLMSVHMRLTACAIGLVIGGALSNVLDRLMRGAVADFFYFHLGPHYWPAFNMADAAICLGVALLCLESMLGRGKTRDS